MSKKYKAGDVVAVDENRITKERSKAEIFARILNGALAELRNYLGVTFGAEQLERLASGDISCISDYVSECYTGRISAEPLPYEKERYRACRDEVTARAKAIIVDGVNAAIERRKFDFGYSTRQDVARFIKFTDGRAEADLEKIQEAHTTRLQNAKQADLLNKFNEFARFANSLQATGVNVCDGYRGGALVACYDGLIQIQAEFFADVELN